MKATNNNVDTLFMDIFVELFAIAKVYFQELFKNADPGTYTIKDIYAFIEKNIETPKEGDYVEFNLSCNVDAPIYTGLVTNDPGLGLVCVVDGQKIEVRKMVNLKVLKPKEGKTVSPIQSEKESSLNDKERGETKQIERDNSIQPKETKPTMQYTDDMLELVSLDLDSMTYTVNGDVGTEKDIASIVLYDKIGKIVVYCDDGEKIECQFDGESVLQSVINEMSVNFK